MVFIHESLKSFLMAAIAATLYIYDKISLAILLTARLDENYRFLLLVL